MATRLSKAEFQEALQELGMNQKGFAARCGMHVTTISGWQDAPLWATELLAAWREVARLRGLLVAIGGTDEPDAAAAPVRKRSAGKPPR